MLKEVQRYLECGIIQQIRENCYQLKFQRPEALAAMHFLLADHGVFKYSDEVFRPDRINNEWIGGFFAAEGSASVNTNGTGGSSILVTITQTSHPEVLEAIKERLGYGSISCGQWRAHGSNAYNFAIQFHKLALHKGIDLVNLVKWYEEKHPDILE
jgi:hypothetical protein